MLKKRYLLILIVCLFAVSAVSGAEIGNDTNDVLSIDTDVSTANEEIVNESDNVLSIYNDDSIELNNDKHKQIPSCLNNCITLLIIIFPIEGISISKYSLILG